jgi:hypothetical protein
VKKPTASSKKRKIEEAPKSLNPAKKTQKKSPSSEPSPASNKKSKKSKEAETKAEIVTPEEKSSDDVSDTDVSDVSSVEVSSSSSDDNDSSSSDESSSSEDEKEVAEALKKRNAQKKEEAARKAREAAKAAMNWKPSPKQNPTGSTDDLLIKTVAGTDGAQALAKGTPFKRVDSDYWGSVASRDGGAVADNSYEGAFGASGFGARSSEKLLAVRGKDFRHEKTKRKRSFNGIARTGGQINTGQSFSTKYQYSDDE